MAVGGKFYRTVIFDLDGTLSDSAVLTVEAFRNLAPKHNLPVPSGDAIRSAMGYANPEFYYRLYPDAPQDMIYEFGQLIEAEEARIIKNFGGRLLFKGCKETLEGLKERGVRLCIASTGDRQHVYDVLTAAGITGLFDEIRCGESDKVEMLKSMTENGDKSGYLMVGDMKKDADGARANGIRSAGACYGYCRRELAEFDMYIDEPEELEEMADIWA